MVKFTALDRYPLTPSGHVAFLEWVRGEVEYAAEAVRQRLKSGYSRQTLENVVRGIRWAEARRRTGLLAHDSDFGIASIECVSTVLHRELSVDTVEQIAELFRPAVNGLREYFERSRYFGESQAHQDVSSPVAPPPQEEDRQVIMIRHSG